MTAEPQAERRRPGPRTDIRARDLVIDVAERLFAESPPEGISLRAVAREAGVAPAAVKYHFGTKAGLLEAVFRRRGADLAERVRDRLAAAADRPGRLSARDLVEAILLPYVEIIADDPARGLRWMKIYVRLAMGQDPLWVAEVDRDPSIGALFITVASRALPDLTDLEVQRRTGIAMFTMLAALSNADVPAYGYAAGPEGLDPRFVEQLVVFTSAGLEG